jgi:plasmid stabilization system protein ParE
MTSAVADLRNINQWLSELADREMADRITDAIFGHANRLHHFLFRRSPRPDLGTSLHSILWRQRATILYRVSGHAALIVAIRYAG